MTILRHDDGEESLLLGPDDATGSVAFSGVPRTFRRRPATSRMGWPLPLRGETTSKQGFMKRFGQVALRPYCTAV